MKLCLFLLPLLPLVYGHGALVHPPPRNRVIIIMMNKMIDMDGKALYLFTASLHNSLVCIEFSHKVDSDLPLWSGPVVIMMKKMIDMDGY